MRPLRVFWFILLVISFVFYTISWANPDALTFMVAGLPLTILALLSWRWLSHHRAIPLQRGADTRWLTCLQPFVQVIIYLAILSYSFEAVMTVFGLLTKTTFIAHTASSFPMLTYAVAYGYTS